MRLQHPEYGIKVALKRRSAGALVVLLRGDKVTPSDEARFSERDQQSRPPPTSNSASKNEHEVSGVVSCSSQSALSKGRNLEPDSQIGQNDSGQSGLNSHQVPQSQQQKPSYKSGKDANYEKRICSYFAKGLCRYGRYCKFIHHAVPPRFSQRNTTIRPNVFPQGDDRMVTPQFFKPEEGSVICSNTGDKAKVGSSDTSACRPTSSPSQSASGEQCQPQRQVGKTCAYYKSGRCKKGVNCKFLHPSRNHATYAPSEVPSQALLVKEKKSTSGKDLASNPVDPAFHDSKPREVIYRRNQRSLNSQALKVFTLTELDESIRDELRNEEIEAIKRRFPKDKIMYKYDGDAFEATIKFAPSDPDWPFDVKEYTIAVVIPPSYPNQTFSVTLPLDQDLPNTVRRYVEVSIQEWIEERQEQLKQKGKVELLFRPFLRWLDRTIEEITTKALLQLKRELTARAAGLEFVPSKRLQAKFYSVKERSEEDNKKVGSDVEEDTDDNTEDENQDSSTEDDDEKENSIQQNQSLELQPQQRGTEISLKHLQLKMNAAALLFQRIKVILQCGRCKGHSDLNVVQGSVISVSCNRCNQDMYVTYRPGLLHQFSSVLGYLDLDGCQAFDLVLQDCRANVSCMACNKQTTIDGLVTGQLIDGWCKACNAKFKFATEAVKLTQLAPSGIDTSSAPVIKAVSSKPKKPPKDPSIREGYPLPNFGTCKHYKHSYRWLRFPCCGKAYPCDVCHDKQEDHEMIFANRMICGHCCKEQNFSASRPCSGCGQHMTKVRSAHWEGGSGCRDKISMSKGDTQKYKNMNKTVSNKKKMESGPKKKSTKLRHA
ncbi:cleavage and polyadenylation-specificity factor subunit [Elysia marginata]|uniref:Cleavage and polyadenylation-specificity factor subunit n=1 Tax=Elysia marginata TaxID=1093978 RepID=A0AAV4GM41_9GAST|nr:cleavage and polyadenylation-specificity factor subunit [Elysia marginata]